MIQEFEKIRVLIAYDGVVHWEPGGVFHGPVWTDRHGPRCPVCPAWWSVARVQCGQTDMDHDVQSVQPGGVFMTTCDIEILYFPFDMQACQVELGMSDQCLNCRGNGLTPSCFFRPPANLV